MWFRHQKRAKMKKLKIGSGISRCFFFSPNVVAGAASASPCPIHIGHFFALVFYNSKHQ
jgi:hypothetical protein